MIELSTVRPDFPSLVEQLQAYVGTDTNWKDLLTSGTGQTLVEMIAGIGALDQYAIESAYRESFLDTARRDSSVYAIATMLGVRLNRKLPCSCRVKLTRPASASSLTIPPYLNIAVGNTLLFNRDAIVFDPNVTEVTAVFHEGTLKTTELTSSGTDFERFKSSEAGFVVSDADVWVTVNDVSVAKIKGTLWNYRNYNVVLDTTDRDGSLVLSFGNRDYGLRPTTGSQVKITYAVTGGADASNVNLAGSKAAFVDRNLSFSYEIGRAHV